MPEYYRDTRDWLDVLEKNGLLHVIDRPIIKETELSPLVRLQYRGLPEEQRKGFVFSNVRNVKGRKYEARVATGVYASSLKMYGLGLMCSPTREAVQERWTKAQLEPIEPEIVSSGPVQEHVYTGDELLEEGKGLEYLPISVELPGFSGQIRTSTQIITETPQHDWRNMGTYSGHVFGKTTVLWEISRINHGYAHLNAWKDLGKDMPAAIVIGGPPLFFYVGSAKLKYGIDELAVAGGLAGRPIELVKCKTIDLSVPAYAEIIVEGLVSTRYMEPGNAYGEFNGYMATDVQVRPLFEVTAVTHRSNPLFVHIMSQFPPSESSKVRQVSSENVFLKYLKYDCRLPGILDVAWHEISQAQWCVIKIKKTSHAHSWQVLHTAAGYDPHWGKYYITVDEDIDPRDFDSVVWALGWRVQPARDVEIIRGRHPGLDVSAYKQTDSYEEKQWPGGVGSSAMLIDATVKFAYPPTALPRKDFMENALKIWEELKLPELTLKEPWYGHELGYWPREFREDAEQIIKGEH